MWKPPVLETERLILRDLRESDAQAVFSYARKPRISKYTLWEPHQSVDDSLSYIKDYAWKSYAEEVPEPFAIELKSNGKMIGCTGCFWVSRRDKTMELAYVISDEYWGQGIVAEASMAVLEYCFGNCDVERIQCRCKAENDASLRVMEKLGMKYEGNLRNSLFHRNRFWDMKCCSILKEEFLAR